MTTATTTEDVHIAPEIMTEGEICAAFVAGLICRLDSHPVIDGADLKALIAANPHLEYVVSAGTPPRNPTVSVVHRGEKVAPLCSSEKMRRGMYTSIPQGPIARETAMGIVSTNADWAARAIIGAVMDMVEMMPGRNPVGIYLHDFYTEPITTKSGTASIALYYYMTISRPK
jgi:hypothetical protein